MRLKGFLATFFLAILIFALSSVALAVAPIVYTEDFDGTFNSSIFNNSQIFNDGAWNGTYFASENGYNGGTSAFKIAANGTNTTSYLGTHTIGSLGFENGKSFYINMKVKFTQEPVDGTRYIRSDMNDNQYINWDLYGEADGKYHIKQWSDNAESRGAMATGKWYDMTMKIDGTYCYTYIYDTETGEQVVDEIAQVPPGSGGSRGLFLWFYNIADFEMLIDDAIAYSLANDDTSTAYIGGNVEDNDVERNKIIELSFTRPVDTTDILVKDSDGNNLPDGSYIVKKSGFCSNRIVFKTLLEKNAQYTIDLSETGADNITFTTKAQYILDAECNAAVDTENNKKLNVSYLFNEKNGIEKISCRMMGILYKDGKMIDAAALEIIPTAVNTNTEIETSLTFTKEITADTSISLVFFESGAYIPMSTGISCD